MDTQHLAQLARAERQCIGLVCDPRADPAERWLASIGLDVAEVGPTPAAALDAALTRAILGPECRRQLDPDELDPLPFTDAPDD